MGKAPKKAPTGGLDSSEVIILKYLQTQNRPYSATDIFNNLHGQVGKTAVAKALTTLVEKGEISGKAYGKQWVYVARQDLLEAPSPADLEQLDSTIEDLKIKTADQKEAVKQLQSQFNSLQSSMTNEEMRERITDLTKKISVSNMKLDTLRSGMRRVDPGEKAKVDKLFEVYQKEWKNRKRMCMEVVNGITENLPQSPKQFMEELGCELDQK